jgi:hypothetical protein
MKHLAQLAVLFVLGFVTAADAQVPKLVSYQGVLTDNGGNPVADGVYNVTFRVFDQSFGGAPHFTEAHSGPNAVTTVNGAFSAIIGSLDPLTLPFDVQYWLELQVNADPALAPRILLTSSPYALMAHTVVDNAITSAKIATGAVGSPEIADGGIATADLAIGAVTGARILDATVEGNDIAPSAISAPKIGDEPGIASNSTTVNNALTAVAENLTSRDINVPSGGYVIARGSTNVSFNHTMGTTSTTTLSLSTTSATHNASNQRAVAEASAAATGIYNLIGTVEETFPVSAGLNTFYLVASAPSGTVTALDANLTLIFFTTIYGTATEPLSREAGSR